MYAHVITDVYEYVCVTQGDKREFAKVRVCTEVLQSVHLKKKYPFMSQTRKSIESGTDGLPKKTIRFIFVLLPPFGAVLPAHMYTAFKSTANERF